jgi:hypothetical protein
MLRAGRLAKAIAIQQEIYGPFPKSLQPKSALFSRNIVAIFRASIAQQISIDPHAEYLYTDHLYKDHLCPDNLCADHLYAECALLCLARVVRSRHF